MSDLRHEVSALREALRLFEVNDLDGSLSTAALQDFKVAIDRVRHSVFDMLTAADGAEYHSLARRNRLRRAALVCQGILAGLADGTIDPRTEGLGHLHATVDEILKHLESMSAVA